MSHKALPAARKLRRDRSGVAAVEFALLAPLMMLLLFGSIELTEMVGAKRRVDSVAGSVADLVARDRELSAAEINDIFTAADLLVFPADPEPLTIVLTRVDITGPSQGQVNWSRARRAAPRPVNAPVVLPQNAESLCPGDVVIMAEATFTFRTPVGMVMDGLTRVEHRQLTCPRITDDIILVP